MCGCEGPVCDLGDLCSECCTVEWVEVCGAGDVEAAEGASFGESAWGLYESGEVEGCAVEA